MRGIGPLPDSPMDGLLVIDKPAGPTSHDVVARVRRALRERRIGHTGTLDPAATGVLPLVLGRATRLAQFLSASDKSYEAVVRLGFATDTGDAEGAPLGPVARGAAAVARRRSTPRSTPSAARSCSSRRRSRRRRSTARAATSWRAPRRARRSADAARRSGVPASQPRPGLPAPVERHGARDRGRERRWRSA